MRIPLDKHNALYLVDERYTQCLFLPKPIFAFAFGSADTDGALEKILEYVEANPKRFKNFLDAYENSD